jgi:transcriptional regulator PpsR
MQKHITSIDAARLPLDAASMKPLAAPEQSLGTLDAKTAAQLISASSDLVLIVDDKGVIRDLSISSEELSDAGTSAWLGRPWIETVTVESRPKVEALLRAAVGGAGANGAGPRWRHVNHPGKGGGDIPLLYSAIRVDKKKRVVAVGRDLRHVAALQQQLVAAQQAMERDYWHLRTAETRYRHLFQAVPEAILIVDAQNLKIVEANQRATKLFGDANGDPAGRAVVDLFDAAGGRDVQALLAAVRASAQADETRARDAARKRAFKVMASLFRQESLSMFLLRIVPQAGAAAAPQPAGGDAQRLLVAAVERVPDAFVVTDLQGRILTVNSAFLDLSQVASEEKAVGEPLERWLGRAGVDMNVVIANLRQHGSLRLFATRLRGEQDLMTEVEISAVSVPSGARPCLGFVIRNVGRRLSPNPRAGRASPRSVEQLTELVGRVPLKDLVQESTDLIEKLCIEAALALTQDNRASAAEMLGLSRQSLYVKMHRYGIGDLGGDTG